MPKSKVSASARNKAIDPTRAAINSKVLKTRDAAKTKTKNTKATVCTNEELEIATASRGDVILMESDAPSNKENDSMKAVSVGKRKDKKADGKAPRVNNKDKDIAVAVSEAPAVPVVVNDNPFVPGPHPYSRKGKNAETVVLNKYRASIDELQNIAHDEKVRVAARYEGAKATDAIKTTNNVNHSKYFIKNVTDTKCSPEDVICKPEGQLSEPGRGGYKLREAMQLNDSKDYSTFRSTVRSTVIRCHVDYSVPFSQQLPEVIANFCKLLVKEQPYLTKNRFPGYWASRAALKSNISYVRRYETRKTKGKRVRPYTHYVDTQAEIHIEGESDEEKEEEEEEEEDDDDGFRYERGPGDVIDDNSDNDEY
ncbi:hypothetical protein F5876DRAFT_70602 [Lentinula aff. lateritia]|uniref:Uncharacterized protein n=1 Tax=Lentinula aff. lateritia TaxID=2804960 RepID=A0ACC1TI78_9AGAR|nr:hypothetical protein F5876DRAFT_70602 [Lentinula aff. lateritia]